MAAGGILTFASSTLLLSWHHIIIRRENIPAAQLIRAHFWNDNNSTAMRGRGEQKVNEKGAASFGKFRYVELQNAFFCPELRR